MYTMKSKWFRSKRKAISLRKEGLSIREIENRLGIPRSTLSGWLKAVELTEVQKRILKTKYRNGLILARKKAVLWHNQQKFSRLKNAEEQADKVLSRINTTNEILELALALLYLGEGSKKNLTTSMGNSDPLVLKFFLSVIQKVYGLEIMEIRAYLHLRADQDPKKMLKYWSKELGIPISSFKKTSIDKRTIQTITYPHYKGVCVIECGNVAIQRKLVYISRKFCEKISK